MTIDPASMRRLRFAAVMLSLAGLPAAVAQGAPGPGWEQREAARDAAEGQRLLKEGRYDEALFKLKAAYAVEPTAETMFGMAGAQRGGGRTLEAYATYEMLLRDRASELTADQRQSAETALAELGLKTGTLKLAIADPEASCTVDGEPVTGDARGKPIRLLIGAHKVVLATSTGTATSFDVIIRRGKETQLAVPSRREAAGAPVALTPPPPAPVPVPPPAAVPPQAAPPARVASASLAVPTAPASPAPPVSAPPAPTPVPWPSGAPEAAAQPSPPVEPIVPAPPASAEPLPPTFEPAPDHGQAPTQSSAPPADDPLRVGVIVGIASFPRPVEVELAFKLGRWFGLGLEGSFLPELSVPGVDAKLDLKAVQGVFRWYPFGGAFFLGGGLGYQNFQASFGETVDNGQLDVTADMSGAFIIPQVGWMFITDSGLSFGINFGIQIPIPKEPVVTAAYNRQPVPAQASSSVPQDVIDQAQTNVDNVRSVAKFIVRYPFPEIDFLRIGLFF
jgi:hypothetical protein